MAIQPEFKEPEMELEENTCRDQHIPNWIEQFMIN